MESIFRRIISSNFSDVAGLTADITIPVSQLLANELIGAALQGSKDISACQVSIHEQNGVSVRLKTSRIPWTLNLMIKLDSSLDFGSFSSPKVRAWLENNRALGSLAAFFHALPEWLELHGNQVVVDLGFFLQTPEHKRLFNLVKSVGIRTEVDKAIFDVKIRIEEGDAHAEAEERMHTRLPGLRLGRQGAP